MSGLRMSELAEGWDVVFVERLRVDAGIGVYPHEQGILQRLELDLWVGTDVRAAADGDDLGRTVDYDALAAIARRVACAQHHQLIETVAERIAEEVLRAWPRRVQAVRVRVRKLGALADADAVGVELLRRRG